uniref:Uncharacterized protein n=1 Tax=Panagrellus redivivus TaxID=6233 RepID=A0A7E4UUX2_PANRE
MSTPYFFPSLNDTALFSIAETPTVPKKYLVDSDSGSLIFSSFDEIVDHIVSAPFKGKCVINCCIPDSNLERERRWKLLESKGFEKVIHYSQNAASTSVALKTLKVEAAIGETVIYGVNWMAFFLTKHATGWSVDVDTEDDPKLFFNQFNIKRVFLDSRQGSEANAKIKNIFVPYKVTEVTVNRATDATWRFMKSLANGDNYDGYLIDNYDVVGLFAEFKGTSTCIHNGVTKFPFEKSVELEIGDASQLVVNAVRHQEVYLIKLFNMKTKKLRRVRLTIKQHNLWKFEASLTILDRQDVIESGMAGLNLSETPK